MIQIIKKSEQFNATIFNGNFIANKPVASGTKSIIKPYSNLFYWSHAPPLPHESFRVVSVNNN
jgi:hypothetical protein